MQFAAELGLQVLPEYADVPEYGLTAGTDEMYEDIDAVRISGLELHNPAFTMPLAGNGGTTATVTAAPPPLTEDNTYDNGEAGFGFATPSKTNPLTAVETYGTADVGVALPSGDRRHSRRDSYDTALDTTGNPPDDAAYEVYAGIFQPPPGNRSAGADEMIYDNGEAGALPPNNTNALYAVAERSDDVSGDASAVGSQHKTDDDDGDDDDGMIYAVAERDDAVSGSAAGSQHKAAAADDMIYAVAERDDAVYGDASVFQPEPANPDAGASDSTVDMIYDNGEAGSLPPTAAPTPSQGGRVISPPGAETMYADAEIFQPAPPAPASAAGTDAIYGEIDVERQGALPAATLWRQAQPRNLAGGRGLDVVSQTSSMVGMLPVSADDIYESVDEVPPHATAQRPPAVPTTKRPNNRGGGANAKAKTKKRPPALVSSAPPSARLLPTVPPSQGEVIYGGGDDNELYADADETGASAAAVARSIGDIYAMPIKNQNKAPSQQGDVIYSAGIDGDGDGGGGGDALYAVAEIYAEKMGATVPAAADDVYAVSTKTLGRRTKP